MKKKGQLQLGETIAILTVFFIIIMVLFTFFFRIVKSKVEEGKEIGRELRTVGVVQKILAMPELQCSSINVENSDCIDKLKLDAVSKTLPTGATSSPGNIFTNNPDVYFPILEWSEINVYQIYPNPNDPLPTVWNVYSNELDIFTNKIVTNIPVTIYDPEDRKHAFGRIEIATFSN
tara:strand:- start:30216 stop:30743 length:528 start_codon:yes stop_codon:yes gene_type:complete